MSRAALQQSVERYGLLGFLLLLIAFFAVTPETSVGFMSQANIQNLLANQSVTGILAIAMVIPLVCDHMDLSVPAIAGAASVAFASVIGTYEQSLMMGILVALAISLTIGCINGFLIAIGGLSSFVVTLGMFTLLGGLLHWYTGGRTITENIPEWLGSWGSYRVFGVPMALVPLAVVAIGAWYLLMHTSFGRELESIGDNPRAAKLVGLRVKRAVFLTFIVSSLLAATGGIILTTRLGGADPTAGTSYLFPAFAAVFLGATVFRVGRYNVWGTIVGVFLTAVAVNGIALYGAAGWVTPAFNGIALIVAVGVSTLAARRRARGTVHTRAAEDVPSSGGAPDEVAAL